MKVRLVRQSTSNGDSEYMTFTDDFEDDAENFLYSGHTIDVDQVIEMDDTPGFPMNHDFKRT